MIDIIELAKKAARETNPDYTGCEPSKKDIAGLERFAALYKQALIDSGELVPAEKVQLEREECAKVCDRLAEKFERAQPLDGNKPYAAACCASEIRAGSAS